MDAADRICEAARAVRQPLLARPIREPSALHLPAPMTQRDTTVDTIGADRLQIAQHDRGFRFGLDALLLATDLPRVDPGGTVVELGAAQGAVALSIARRREDLRVVAVERQPALYALLAANVARNGLGERVAAVEADLRDWREIFEPHTADLVVCNPPYYPAGQRRPSSDPERASAHHELHGTLDDFVAAARYVLTQRGWLKLIIPPMRLVDLWAACAGTDLGIVSLRFVHSDAAADAYLVEAVLRRGGAPESKVRPPLYIYADPDTYTAEVARRIAHAAGPEDA